MESDKFYDMVDCVIVPSEYNEPFGRVAMEAIFKNRYVIVSDKGGLPEQIVEGVVGVICKDNQYYDCMNAIISTYNARDKEPLNYNGLASLLQFTIEHSAEQYLKIYKLALNGVNNV